MDKVKSKKKFQKVRAAMIEVGYDTQEMLAKEIGMDRSTLNQKLNGRSDFTLPECLKIARALKKTLDYLFFD